MNPERRALWLALTGGLACIFMPGASAAQTSGLLAVLQRELGNRDANYLQAKLAFDAMIDPGIDHVAAARAVDRLCTAARELAGASADDAAKLAAVRTVIYRPGAWNDDRPFAYDMRDPLGRNIDNKLLATYVRTRLGNCVSMPALFLIIADSLGLDVGLATAPHHVFVRYTAPDGRAVNLEATSGGHPARDLWYREHMPMTDAAIASGIYMRTLSPRESVATMGLIVGEFLLRSGRYEETIDIAEAINQHAPRDVESILLAAVAYGRMFTEEFEQRYPTLDSIPRELHPRYLMLAEMNASLYARAEELGWRASE